MPHSLTLMPQLSHPEDCAELFVTPDAPGSGLADFFPTARIPPHLRFGGTPGPLQLVDGAYFPYTARDGAGLIERAVGRYRTGPIRIERPSNSACIYMSSNGGSPVDFGVGATLDILGGAGGHEFRKITGNPQNEVGGLYQIAPHDWARRVLGNGSLVTWSNPTGVAGPPTLLDGPLVEVQNEIHNVITASGLTPTVGANELLTALYRLMTPTGTVIAGFWTTAAPGWVLLNDGTIGNAASLATTRANADTAALFTLLWTNVTNTYAPVTGGRGASAAADFAANKPIRLPLALGRALASAGAGAGLATRPLGSFIGEEETPLNADQNATHAHLMEAGDSPDPSGGAFLRATSTGLRLTSLTSGLGLLHNTMQPTMFINFMIKL